MGKRFDERKKMPVPEAAGPKQVVYRGGKKMVGGSEASHPTPKKVKKGPS